MATYVMLTRLIHDTLATPGTLPALEDRVTARIEEACPGVAWKGSYAVLGPYDYLDIFEAPDNETATKVATLIRTHGHAHTETWPATEWERFKQIVGELDTQAETATAMD